VAAAEMSFAGGFSLELDLRAVPNNLVTRNDFLLFSESNSRFLVEVAEQDRFAFEDLMKNKACAQIGKVTNDERLLIQGLNGKAVVDASLVDLQRNWKKTLSCEVQPK
jgi:phosphoribosylformylglycinamidine synthase